MKIVHLLFNLRYGGTETLLIDIVNNQVSLGHDVSLILINDIHEQTLLEKISGDVKIKFLNRHEGSKNPLWIWRLNRAILSEKPDIVHAHNVKALGLIYCKHNYKLVFTYHTTGIVNPWVRKLDMQFAISNAVREDVTARGYGDAKVVYNGIAVDDIVTRQHSDEVPTHFKFVQVGRLNKLKGQDFTIEALSKVKHKNLTIDFIGDGDFRDYLEDLAKRLGVSDRVNFLGTRTRKEIYNILYKYDCGLMTSRIEGFGLTLAEALAAKLPVITCNLPGPLEVVDNGRFALTFISENPDDLSQKMDEMIEYYEKHTQLAENAAYDFVINNFSIKSTVARYLAAYEAIK